MSFEPSRTRDPEGERANVLPLDRHIPDPARRPGSPSPQRPAIVRVVGLTAALLASFALGRVSAGGDSTAEDAASGDDEAVQAEDTVNLTGWELTFSDEFDGGELDLDKWTPEYSTFGHGNGELQCHTPDNVTVSGGMLHVSAQRGLTTCPNGEVREYSSGLLRTRDLHSQALGAFEIRAKVPEGEGFLSAFWLLSQGYPFGREGRSGELDVMEVLGRQTSTVTTSVHWGYSDCGWGCDNYSREVPITGSTASEDFHVYRLEWEEHVLRWLVDGRVVYTLGRGSPHRWGSGAVNPSEGSPTFPAPFDETNPMYMIISLAVGGSWPGEPDESTPFPASMEIDYVRAYESSN